MEIINTNIDHGKLFDFGKTSDDYAKFRDIYPPLFYKKIIDRDLCLNGQKVLDLGTGTGVIPRNMYKYGAQWTGTDISENQIKQAKILSQNMNIDYFVKSAENLDFEDNTFDVITACQCFWYFDHEKIMPELDRILKNDGSIVLLQMEWLPFEDKIANGSEQLVLKYNPQWSGAGEKRHAIEIPECYSEKFKLNYHEEYPVNVHFTRETWNGRMKTCRGISASLSDEKIARWEKEHLEFLNTAAPEEFDVLHYAGIAELKKI